MRTSKLIFCIIFILINYLNIFGNPIAPNYINEFGFTDTGWKMEIFTGHHSDTCNCDGFFLTNSKDTAYFKNGIYFKSDYLVITEDSLQTEFSIDKNYDNIFLGGAGLLYGSIVIDSARFPLISESGYSMSQLWEAFETDYYLDSSPTFGLPNDTTGALGEAVIQLTDSSGKALDNVYVWHDRLNNYFTYAPNEDSTNEKGRLSFRDLAGPYYVCYNNEKDLMEAVKKEFVLYPGSTMTKRYQVEFSDTLSNLVQTSSIIRKYKLSNNYPNPFNNATNFSFQIPTDDYVELNLYDIQGRLVKSIESGFKKAGEYKIKLNLSGLQAGLYFYRLETGNRTITKKCMYIK